MTQRANETRGEGGDGAAATAVGRDLRGLRVLLAEDSFNVTLVLETALEAEGAVVIGPAGTLEAACELAGSQKPDLAIVDLDLGGLDASPLVHQLMDSGAKVILATGYDLPQDTGNAFSGLPVLKKPYTPAQLIDHICLIR